MLSKLLKHEFRATARIMLPLYLILLASAGMLNLFLRLSTQYDLPALHILEGISSVTFAISLFGAGAATFILMVYRFYKNYMKDEGYLMFTLPVTSGQLIWSKLIVALVWSAVSLLAIVGALFVATLGQTFWSEVRPFFHEFWQYITSQISSGNLAGFIAELAGYIILTPLAGYLMIFAAISLGHSFANHKILLSVIFYFGFNMAIQTISSFGVFGFMAISGGDLATFEPTEPIPFLHTVFITTLALALLEGIVFYLITHFTLKKRLNLQ